MYRLGQIGATTLSDDLKRIWFKIRGKENPFLKIGEEDNRAENGGKYMWALKDINLSVKKGEVVGIIGKNGARTVYCWGTKENLNGLPCGDPSVR